MGASALEENENRFRAIFDAVNDAIFIMDPANGKIMDVNRTMCEMYGYTREEALNLRFSDLCLDEPPYDEAGALKMVKESLEKGRRLFEWLAKARDGRRFWIEVNVRIAAIDGRNVSIIVVRDISERKDAEARLREGEDRYRQLFELGSEAIIMVDNRTGRILEANGAASSLTGYSIGELAGMKNSDLSAEPEETMRVTRTTPLQPDRIIRIPRRLYKKKDGTVFPVEITARFFLRDGAPVNIAALRDITERARAETALQESEQRFRTLAEASFEGIALTEDGVVTDCNDQLVQMLGWSRSELVGKSIMDFTAPESRALAEEAMRTEEQRPYEHMCIRKDGTVFPVEIRARSARIGSRTVRLKAINDITRRRQTEDSLRESEARYRAIVESQVDLVSRYLPDTTLTFVNDAYCEFFGKTREELIGQSYLFMIAPDFREVVRKETENFPNDPVPISGEYVNIRHDGAERWIQWVVQGIRDKDDRVVELQAVGHDINRLKTAEAEIRALNDGLERRVRERTAQLEAAVKELEAFSYSVSHDLRAPLRAINGYTSILMKECSPSLDEKGARMCSAVLENTVRMGKLIDDLLSFSRLGRVEIQSVEIAMEEAAGAAFLEVTTQENRGRIDLRLEAMPRAMGDPTLIRQVWINLLSNAVKFSAKRDRPVIHAGGMREGAENVYFVRDNGAGFDMQYADKLFGVFQRLHTEREFTGTGVGLAIVSRVVLRHGGRVWAEGEQDKGATFFFALPVP